MKKYLILLCACTIFQLSVAQNGSSSKSSQMDNLPKAFQIGEYDDNFDQLEQDHDMLLLSACNDNMDMAFRNWMTMIYDIEQFAGKQEFDIKGVKMWLYVYWKNNGSINHIAYHLKPNSRNIKAEDLSNFLSDFANHYSFSITASSNFSHHGSASFPTMFEHARNH